MSITQYSFRVGQTIKLGFRTVSGDLTGWARAADLRRAEYKDGTYVPLDAAPVAASFAITDRAEVGQPGDDDYVAPGLDLTIDAATSANLEPGDYIADAKFTLGAAVEKTTSVLVVLTEAATQ